MSAAEDAMNGDSATISHAVSGGDYAGEPAAAVTVRIERKPPVELSGLQVTGAGTMYPAFAGYAFTYRVPRAPTCRSR